MKTTILLVLSVLYLSSFAQNFVLSVGGGGDAPIARVYTSAYQSQVSTSSGISYTQRVKPVSLGQGGNVYVAFDWFSKKGFGAGVKVNGFFGAPFIFHSEEVYNSNIVKYDVSQRGFSGQFIPHLNFKHDFDRITPVVELGMMIGINGIQETTDGYFNNTSHMHTVVWEKGGVSLGFYSSLGIWIRLSRTVRLSVSATCIAASYSPTHWERTLYNVDGRDMLSQVATSDRYGRYVTEMNNTTPQSPNSPRQSLKYAAPFSNAGLNIGFSFILGHRNGGASKEKTKTEVHSF